MSNLVNAEEVSKLSILELSNSTILNAQQSFLMQYLAESYAGKGDKQSQLKL